MSEDRSLPIRAPPLDCVYFLLCVCLRLMHDIVKVAQILYCIYILWFHIYTQKWVYPLTLVSTKMMIAFRLKYTWRLVPTQYSVHVQVCASWVCEKVVRPKADLPDGLLYTAYPHHSQASAWPPTHKPGNEASYSHA